MGEHPLRSDLRRYVFIFAVNLVTLALLVAATEYLSSFFTNRPGENLVPDYRLNHRWKPNLQWVHDEWAELNPDFSQAYIHLYNSQGWLSPHDISLKKKPNTYRIFYVGDSFTEGTCPMEMAVPSIVERSLNEMTKGKKLSFEVINTGTASYSPTLFYILVRYVLMDYQPDLIVVNVDMTDDYDDWKYSHTLIVDEQGNPYAAPQRDIFASDFIATERGTVRATWWSKARLILFKYSYTYRLAQILKAKYFSPTRDNPAAALFDDNYYSYPLWSWCKEDWDAVTTKNVRNSLDILRRLALFCRKNNVKLMLTSVPHYWQYAGNQVGSGKPLFSSRPHYEMQKMAKEESVNNLTLP